MKMITATSNSNFNNIKNCEVIIHFFI